MSPTGTITGRGMTFSDVVARWARVTPDAVMLVDASSGARRTYAETDTRITRLANRFTALGVTAGDRVAVLGANSAELLEAYIATIRAGAICVPLNFRYAADEIAYTLGDCGASCVVVDRALTPTLDRALRKVDGDPPVITIDGDLDEVLTSATTGYVELPTADDDTALIMYTSGTTGRPKGAMLSHRNLCLHAYSNIATVGTRGGPEVWLSGAPLFHIAGVGGAYNAITTGGTVVIPRSGGFDPAGCLELLERERVTACFYVPSQWSEICAVEGISGHDLSRLNRIYWGAAPASTGLLRTMIATFPEALVVTSFGQTECSPVTTTLRGEDAIRKIGSIGTPMVNVEVRVVDDDMNDVVPGDVGEIVYRGPLVMSGYWNKPEETAEAFRGGWFHSGDLVRVDTDGYYYVVDRKKDMIISGGENIYCAEVENVLSTHPDVREVSLIGVPDPKWGETPLAVVVPVDLANPPDIDSIGAFCKERLAGYKRPRHVAIVGALPRNPTGKVLKTELRERHRAGELSAEVTGP